MTSERLPRVVLELPADIDWRTPGCLAAVYDADTGEQITTIREIHMYANADGLFCLEAIHLDTDWRVGYELTSVRLRKGTS